MAECLVICSCGQLVHSASSAREDLISSTSSEFSGQSIASGSRMTQSFPCARVACSPRAGQGDGQNKIFGPRFTSDDWQYVGKGLAGCFAGAGLIKYGSILVPQVTQPNLSIALLMITVPVLASVVILTAASSSGQNSDS